MHHLLPMTTEVSPLLVIGGAVVIALLGTFGVTIGTIRRRR